jgi:hypothetical protein
MIVLLRLADPFEGQEMLTEEEKHILLRLEVMDPLAQLILQFGLTNTVLAVN